jgi:hypothetical protein
MHEFFLQSLMRKLLFSSTLTDFNSLIALLKMLWFHDEMTKLWMKKTWNVDFNILLIEVFLFSLSLAWHIKRWKIEWQALFVPKWNAPFHSTWQTARLSQTRVRIEKIGKGENCCENLIVIWYDTFHSWFEFFICDKIKRFSLMQYLFIYFLGWLDSCDNFNVIAKYWINFHQIYFSSQPKSLHNHQHIEHRSWWRNEKLMWNRIELDFPQRNMWILMDWNLIIVLAYWTRLYMGIFSFKLFKALCNMCRKKI